MPSALSPDQRERYDRNLRLPELGEAGQRRLLGSAAVVVGAGGLGSAATLYLAAAGVGRLRLVEPQSLEPSNLNRQVLYAAADAGRPKADAARARLEALNPDCRVETVAARLTARSAPGLVRGCDVVLDCTDNFPTRFALADACWREGRPLVSAAALGWRGQVLTIAPAQGSPCLRCLLPGPPPPQEAPTAREVGILGAVAGALGALEAVEAVKVLLGVGDTLAHRLLVFDGLAGTLRTIRRTRDPACPLCGGGPPR